MTKPATTITSREFDRATESAKRAAMRGPVFITEHEHPAHVLLSLDDYEQLTEGTPGFADPPRTADAPLSANGPSLFDLLCQKGGFDLTDEIANIDLEIPPRTEIPGEPMAFD